MRTKEVLVIGAGIAGCAIALMLAKRGIKVTIVTSSYDERIYHVPFIQQESLLEKASELQQIPHEHLSCSRAQEQLAFLASKSINELLQIDSLLEKQGGIDIHRCLQEQLKANGLVEQLTHHTLIDLITLDRYSLRKADQYRKPTCIGAVIYDHVEGNIEYFLAKEIILATGGASSLYPFSTHSALTCGEGIAIAYRAGARLLNMHQIQFHALGLFEKRGPCFPLPLALLHEGGRIQIDKGTILDFDTTLLGHNDLLQMMYKELLKTHNEHLWLDLTHLDPILIKEKYPIMDTHCLNHGYNIVKDLLPIVPVVTQSCGGIAIDRYCQTNVQRLRAIGGLACTGTFWDVKEEAHSLLESITWAYSCAEEIAKNINKIIYYFPEITEAPGRLVSSSSKSVEEDWKLLREIMWSYVGIKQEGDHLERGEYLLKQLLLLNTQPTLTAYSISQLQLFHSIQTAQIIAHYSRLQCEKTKFPFIHSFGVSGASLSSKLTNK